MALKVGLATGKAWKVGIGTVTESIGNLQEARSVQAGREYGVQVEGVGSDGEIGAILYGSERRNVSVEGFADASTEALGDDLGTAISAGGLTNCFVTKVNITDSNEDFSIARAEGQGYDGITSLADVE
jgi:hypothetical protein